MIIESMTLFHLRIPCKYSFNHAKFERNESDVILIRLKTDQQLEGWGEILPRAYVTGETLENIMQNQATLESLNIVGTRFDSIESLIDWLEPLLNQGRDNLGLVGGLELALWGLMSQHCTLNMDNLFGPLRTSISSKCFTIGINTIPDQIRTKFIAARIQKSTAVKLKVGLDNDRDAECIRLLVKLCGDHTQLRLDGNCALNYDQASQLLGHVQTEHIHSFEEPLNLEHPFHHDQMTELHAKYKIDLMADEALCSQHDADTLIENKVYQWFNIRLGKHGGLLASCKIRDKAKMAGLGVVGGSMVGETTVLTQASTVFLQRSDDIQYVEGLGQNVSWLSINPFEDHEQKTDQFVVLRPVMRVLDEHTIIQKQLN